MIGFEARIERNSEETKINLELCGIQNKRITHRNGIVKISITHLQTMLCVDLQIAHHLPLKENLVQSSFNRFEKIMLYNLS